MNKVIIPIIIFALVFIHITLLKNYYNEVNKTTSLDIQINKTLSIRDIEDFISFNNIDYLDTKNAFFSKEGDIPNQTKLLFAIYNLIEDETLVISQNLLEEQLYKVFGNKIINHEDIQINNEVIFKYKKETQIYEQLKQIDIKNFSSYKKIVSLEKKGNKYIAVFHKFYIKNNYAFSSYGDMINDSNKLFEIKDNVAIVDSINSNYNKKNIEYYTYKYTFKNEFDKLTLIKYEKE